MRQRYGCAVILALLLLVVVPSSVYAQSSVTSQTDVIDVVPPASVAETNGIPFVPGEVAVGFYAGVVMPASLLSDLAVQVIDPLDLRGQGEMGQEDLNGYLLRTPVGKEWDTIDQLNQNPAVAFAEPNWIVQAADQDEVSTYMHLAETPYVVTDPFYQEDQWYLQRINASRAWALASPVASTELGARSIIVSVIDSGVDPTHPEFKDRLLEGRNYFSPTLPATDEFGHGTHIAGLIGAATNNGAGIAGMAPRVRIDPRKVLDNEGFGSISNVAQAIRDATDAGVQIINLSVEVQSYSTVLALAVSYAHGKGVLLIGAAGNFQSAWDGSTPPPPVHYPAAYDDVMAIAATDYEDGRPWYSSVGDEVELAAPGGLARKIYSTWPKQVALKCKDNSYREVDGGGYCHAYGTSMSAAIVSGVAALVWSMRPDATAGEVRAILHETAVPLNLPQDEIGSGRIDAHAAVRRALPGKLTVSPATIDQELTLGSGIVTRTLVIENSSLEPVTWEITNTGTVDWFWIGGELEGDVRYGEPQRTTVVISPTNLAAGTYSSLFWVVGTGADDSQSTQLVRVNVSMLPLEERDHVFLPVIASVTGESISWPLANFAWEISENITPTVYGMTDNSSIGITLPFTFTFKGRSFTDALIHSDGRVDFPAASGGGLSNRCLSNNIGPQLSLLGWWADLDPSIDGGRVSSFQPAPDRFVIEFWDVRSAPVVKPGYQISVQIVLHQNGRVGLNYLSVPLGDEQRPNVTVGLLARDGRFHNQVVCNSDLVEVGEMPISYRSYLFESEDVY